MSTLLYRLGGLCVRRRRLVLLVWVAIIVAVGAGVLAIGSRTNNDMTLPGSEAQRASNLLGREFPSQQNGQSPLVFHVAHGKLTDSAYKRAIQVSLTDIARTQHVTAVVSPFSREGRLLMSADGKTAIAEVSLNVNGGALTQQLARRIFAGADPARRAGIEVEAGGVLGTTLSETGTRLSEVIGLIAALIVLGFTFGFVVVAALPVVTALGGLALALGLIGLLGHLTAIADVAHTVATMIGLGVGIDYALFIVFRHRDQLRAGIELRDSLPRTLATSGNAVVFAGSTVIVALLSLLLARVPVLGAMGYVTALAVAVAVLIAITLLPSLLAVAERRSMPVFSAQAVVARPASVALSGSASASGDPSANRSLTANRSESAISNHSAVHLASPGASDPPRRGGVWDGWARFVTSHPTTTLVVALLALGLLAVPTVKLKLGQEDVGVTPPSTTQRRAFDLISAGFGPGMNGPLVVAVQLRPPATPSTTYTSELREAKRLQRTLESGRRHLVSQARRLRGEQRALQSAQANLRAQAVALQADQQALQARAADLERQRALLLREKARLAAEGARLQALRQSLTTQAETLAGQIAALQQQIAASQDPTEIAQLQAQLAALATQARTVETQIGALQKSAASLTAQADRLRAHGRQLAGEAAELNSRGESLRLWAARLTAQGETLKERGRAALEQGRRLQDAKRRLERQAQRARRLKVELTKMLTKAGGQPLATDPRLVRLQDALAQTANVASVLPPDVNKTGSAAVIMVTPDTRPAAPQTTTLVHQLRATVIPQATRGQGVTAYVGGVTAAYDDLAALIGRRMPMVIGIILALSFVVLLVAFRSPVVSLTAILCNLLAVAAAFGVLTATFQWGWGLRLVGLGSSHGSVPIASYVPLLMFAGLFGLSTDYEVFLVSRIFEAHGSGQNPHEAVRSGLASTARVITAAAIIMISVFASFILNGDPVIKEFGVGLSVAILLDATLVRMIVVPASMALLGERNWYLPRWLAWLPRVELPES